MTATHILAVNITGPAKSSPIDLNLSLDILSELLMSSEAFEVAKSRGNLTTQPADAGLLALFRDDQSISLLCALDLWESLHKLPAMSVRIALHSGPVDVETDGTTSGKGIEDVRNLLNTGQPGRIVVSNTFAKSLREVKGWSDQSVAITGRFSVEPQRLVILESEMPDFPVVDDLESALAQDGHQTSRDPKGVSGVAWAKALESRIRAADAAVVFVSEDAAESELLQYQLEIAMDERRKRGRPHIIPIWLTSPSSEEGPLGGLARNLLQATWSGSEDTERVVHEVRAALSGGQVEIDTEWLDPAGGAVSGNSKFYVRRTGDDALETALADHESIVLVKGPRQIGKTSLIGRGIQIVADNEWRCVTTDFQKLSSSQLESDTSFYQVLAATLARQSGLDFDFEAEWQDGLTEAMNMDEFIRTLIKDSDRPIVWFMDEADRLFGAPFASEFFGLVRSWHNARATNPRGRWENLTIVIGYATEVHLFIKDLNQSPFNVGRRIDLPMFTLEDTIDLNERYGRPIGRTEDISPLYSLLGGQPFLTRHAFDVLSEGKMTIAEMFAKADQDNGPFGDHLKRILVSVTQLPEVWQALIQSLRTPELADSEGLQRLVAAGILRREDKGYELPCELYRRYIARYAQGEGAQ